MLLAQSEMKTPAFFGTQFGEKELFQALLDALKDIGNGVLSHHGENAADHVAVPIPTDVVCFAKALGERVKDNAGYIDVHWRDYPLRFTAVNEKNVIPLARTLRPLGFRLEQVMERFLVIYATLPNGTISCRSMLSVWRKQVEEKFAHFVTRPKSAKILRSFPKKPTAEHWQLSPECALSTIPL
jgi:hypothetical protein